MRYGTATALAMALAMTGGQAQAQGANQGTNQGASPQMSFFVTSANPGQGGNLGGLAGADAYCRRLAEAVGAGAHDWRAYLSAPPGDARDPIRPRPPRQAPGAGGA